MKTICVAASFAVCLLAVAEAKELPEMDMSKDSPAEDLPIVLDDTNFVGTVVDPITEETTGDKPWFIEFFAPWCPHCQHLAPTWDQFHKDNKDKINVARVDCTSAQGKPLCKKFNVKGYPTLDFFPVGSKTYHTYHGERTGEAFTAWIESEQWKETDSVEIGTNKSIFEELMPTANALLVSLKESFLN